MLYYLTAAGLVAMVIFWGAGLAWLIVPRRWRIYWSLLTMPAGLALQSAVVWVAGWFPVAGTESYGQLSLLLPAGLLAVAVIRAQGWRYAWVGRIGSGPLVLGLALAVALFAVSPWAKRGGPLTTIASGSCDAADYAAGARVLAEFLPADRSGFIGQREVAGILHVDNFFDHWRQLNHFTPSALVALNAAVLNRPVHELTGLLGTVLLATLVPVTVLVARGVVGLPRRAALAVAALVGIGPVQGYAVYQVALGQMLAAAAVGTLTWAGFMLLRDARVPGRAWKWFGVIAVAWWLIVGSYTFFLVVVLAPLAGAFGWGLFHRHGRAALARALGVVAVTVLLVSGFGWERMTGFALRWGLHDTVEYGWPIPCLLPHGWLGLVTSAELHPVAVWWGWPLAAALVAAASWRWRSWATRDALRAWTVAGLVGPAVAGYAILSFKGSVPGSNASYDAYKLLACFHPVLLAGGLWWWRWLRGWTAIMVPFAAVIAVFWGGASLRTRAAGRPLTVTAELVGLQRLEQRADVASINVLCAEMWPRLWANAFLLRKEQYFAAPTYEGRRPTPLRGEWNLVDSVLRSLPPAEGDSLAINSTFLLVRVAAPGRLRTGFGVGWHGEENSGALRWRWTDGSGRIVITNPGSETARARLVLRVRAYQPGRLEVLAAGQPLVGVEVDSTVREFAIANLNLPPGSTELALDSKASSPGDLDHRLLGVALFGFDLQAMGPAID